MTDATVTFLLETVAGIVKNYAELIAGAKGELMELQNELERAKGCLKDVEEKHGKGHHFNVIEKQMREVIYDVEDALDIYVTEVKEAAAAAAAAAADAARANPKRSIIPDFVKKTGSKIPFKLVSTINMAETVRDLRARLAPIYQDATKELDKGSFAERSGALVKKDTNIRRDKVVALKDVEDTIFGYLKQETKAIDYIPITGMPGLGKTTLTCKIFESETMKDAYRIRIWVNVSSKLNKKDVLLQILRVFEDDISKMSNMDPFDLEQQVRSKLIDAGKFLIVLDDVWYPNDLKIIKNLLPDNVMGKVIVTSRDDEVGAACRTRKPYPLRFLTDEESWELLQLDVFEGVGKGPPHLEEVGKTIARSCGGLPLTIVVIGGILVAKDARPRSIGVRKKEWIGVSQNVIDFMKNGKDKSILEAVAFSYAILPEELKECFVYMGVFPEDFEIEAWILIRLWIAERFIVPKEGKSLEETAEEYLNDLVNRNLLLVHKRNPLGENKKCGVHDTIHAFCTTKAKEQNLFQHIKTSPNQGDPSILAPEKYHRICFNSDLHEFLSEGTEYPRARSFLSFYKDHVELKREHINDIPSAFELLRVLNSNTIMFPQYPLAIEERTHLRYLTLYVRNLKLIPESFSNLRNLQTVRVDTNSPSFEMKANLWKMLQLRHFKTNAAVDLLGKEKEGDGGRNIQTLSTLSPGSCTETMATKARNIKELRVRGDLSTLFDAKNNFLEKLRYLEKLKLVNEKARVRLPTTKRFPPILKRLTLNNTKLEWSDMSKLAAIETLEVLKLKDHAFAGKTWTAVVGDGFLSLQYLLISVADLEDWDASPDQFPSLTCLTIKNCGKLHRIPKELATNLQELKIDYIQETVAISAREIQNEKEKDQFQLSIGHVFTSS